MPAPPPSGNPFKNRRLRDQALVPRMMLIVRCNGCHRTLRFWADDLARVFGPDQPAHIPPFKCSKCQTTEWLDLVWTVPSAQDLAEGLIVRRPLDDDLLVLVDEPE